MEFGKLAHLRGVDFSLPPADPRTAATLARSRTGTPLRVHAGCTGWTTKEFVGRVYPEKTPAGAMLEAYGRQFNGLELNSTYYAMPEVATLRRWREAVPAGFRFSPKFPQEVTQGTDLAEAVPTAREFCARLRELGPALGRSFLQLPPGFSPAQAGRLATFLRALPADVPVAVEFRHPGWFRDGRLVDTAFELLADARAAAVITETAGRRDVVHGSLPVPAAMIRFVGNGLDPSDFTRLDDWVPRLAGWVADGLEELWFFAHEPDNVLAPELSNAFVERMNAASGLALKPWVPVPKGGRQLSLL
jgi:uncharacterized protein YecE (DUF72 family)